jgi:hypothetical protein
VSIVNVIQVELPARSYTVSIYVPFHVIVAQLVKLPLKYKLSIQLNIAQERFASEKVSVIHVVSYCHPLTITLPDASVHVRRGNVTSIVNVIPPELPNVSSTKNVCTPAPVIRVQLVYATPSSNAPERSMSEKSIVIHVL